MPSQTDDERIRDWMAALEARHLANLRVPEVTRALRALSSAYVERRQVVARGATLDTAGKRAAFALFYAPLHLLTVMAVTKALAADSPPPAAILDLGCGSGAGGAAWALAAAGSASITGIDRHPWAVDEARWTYGQLGLRGRARLGEVTRMPEVTRGDAIIAAYVLNELTESARARLVARLRQAASAGARLLILEPIAHRVTPWWDDVSRQFQSVGGRADEWRLAIERPPLVALLDKAAGLDHREVKARSIYVPGPSGEAT